MNYFTCPACNRKATLKHRVTFAGKSQLYYGCRYEPCRNHFQVLKMDGCKDQIVAQSPPTEPTPPIPTRSDSVVYKMGCPACGRYGKVKMTTNRRDGYWRRHKCSTCGPYFTCHTVEGVTIHRKMKSLKAIDLDPAA